LTEVNSLKIVFYSLKLF